MALYTSLETCITIITAILIYGVVLTVHSVLYREITSVEGDPDSGSGFCEHPANISDTAPTFYDEEAGEIKINEPARISQVSHNSIYIFNGSVFSLYLIKADSLRC